MRHEIMKLLLLLTRRKELEETASSLHSPSFEYSYNPNKPTSSGFEDTIIDAVDMQEEIDEAMGNCVRSIEDDYHRLMALSGQRRIVLMLWSLCGKSVDYIANRLGVSTYTVERRLNGEKGKHVPEELLLPIEAEVEEYIVWVYQQLQIEVGAKYNEVEQLILLHQRKAKKDRERHSSWLKRLDKKTRYVFGQREKGVCWEQIAASLGCSVRQAKRHYPRPP